MFNYNINWDKVIKENLPLFFHKVFRLAWITALIKPFKVIHSEFMLLRSEYLMKMQYNGQIIYLEKLLNDRFDATDRTIYIDNVADIERVYLYNKSESKPTRFLYNKYNAATAYLVGEFCVYLSKVYIALQNGTGQQPDISPAYWEVYKELFYLKNKSEYDTTYDFIVMVSSGVTFDINEMKGVINYYKLAGKRYNIQTY